MSNITLDTARAFQRLRADDISAFREYLYDGRKDAVSRLVREPDIDTLRRLQGRVQFIEEVLDHITNAENLITKLNQPAYR